MCDSMSKGKKLLFTLAVGIAAFLIVVFSPMKIDFSGMSEIKMEFFSLLIEFAICLAAAVIVKKTGVLIPKKKGFGTGLLVGIVPLIMLLALIPELIENVQTYGAPMTIPVLDFFVFLLNCLLIGVCEELIFRGLIQNSLHEFLGEESQGKVRLAILLQAVIFGCVHFANMYTAKAGFMSSLVQVISAAGMGSILGAVYYRSEKNLWCAITVHALIDLRAFSGTLTGTGTAESLGGYASPEVSTGIVLAVTFAIAFFYFGIALFATRKKVIRPLLQTKD